MRELSVAIVLSALVLGGALLLPYSIRPSLPVQAVAVQKQAETPTAPRIPAPDQAPHRHVQTAQPSTGAGDLEHGRQVYRKCQACHSLEPGKNGLGPCLAGIIGKKAASVPNYNYSAALRASNLTWDAATLDPYLLDPQKLVPGNKMPFPGMKTENERNDVIAYLRRPGGRCPRAHLAPATGRLSPAPGSATRLSVTYIPDVRYTLAFGHCRRADGVLGVGGTIDGQVNPVLSAAEGQVVQITLINGEGAEHDIVFPEQNAKSPRIIGRGASTTLAFRADEGRRLHLHLQRARARARRHGRAIPGHAAAAGADGRRGGRFRAKRPMCRRRSATVRRRPSGSI